MLRTNSCLVALGFVLSFAAHTQPLQIGRHVVQNFDQVYPPIDPGCGLPRVLVRHHDQSWKHGVAWNLGRFQAKNQFITPAHVLHGGQQFFVSCREQVFPVKIKQSSLAYDLALLETEVVHPALGVDSILSDNLKEWRDNKLFQQTLDSMDKIIVPWSQGYRVLYDLLENDPSWNNHVAHLGYKKLYTTHRVSVAQGMSGSPVVGPEQNRPYALKGMVTKTQLGGSYSFVLPTADVLRVLSDLRAGSDPFNRDYPNFSLSQVRNAQNTVMRLTQKSSNKHMEHLCQETLWNPSAGSWADGAGSWADGGGTINASFQFLLEDLFFNTFASNDLRHFGIFNLRESQCSASGLKNSEGKTLAVLRSHEGYKKIRFLEQAFGARPLSDESFNHAFATFSDPAITQKNIMQAFCKKLTPSGNDILHFSGYADERYFVSLHDHRVVPEQNLHMKAQSHPSTSEGNRTSIDCRNPDNISVNINLGPAPFLSLKIRDGHQMSGTLNLDGKLHSLENTLQGWQFQISSIPGLHLKGELGIEEFENSLNLEFTFREQNKVLQKVNFRMGSTP